MPVKLLPGGRLDSGRKLLAQYKARELDETEARSLAQMRAETERSLASQAVALRDAERAAELAAIERRNTDMEAAREARNREAQDIMAGDAASARKVADHQAEASAREKKSATDVALTRGRHGYRQSGRCTSRPPAAAAHVSARLGPHCAPHRRSRRGSWR